MLKYFIALWILFSAAVCYSQETIGSVALNGLMFKDNLQILVFDDPDIQGVACYITYYDRSLSFNDSGRSSISCRKIGPISGNISSKKNIFNMRKGWTFKETIVDRFYDDKRKVLIYLAYQDSISSKNTYHQVSVVPINE